MRGVKVKVLSGSMANDATTKNRRTSYAEVESKLENGMNLSGHEVACFFGITIKTVRNLQESGELPFVKLGRSVRFRAADIKRINNPEIVGA